MEQNNEVGDTLNSKNCNTTNMHAPVASALSGPVFLLSPLSYSHSDTHGAYSPCDLCFLVDAIDNKLLLSIDGIIEIVIFVEITTIIVALWGNATAAAAGVGMGNALEELHQLVG